MVTPEKVRLIWFVASLDQRGGGDRFVLETVRAIQDIGASATIICDRMSDVAGFGGRYDLSAVICLERGGRAGAYWVRALRKALGIVFLYRAARKLQPDLIVCQSEYDAIKVAVVSKILGCPYRVFVFGQMFQLRDDLSKYSRKFRRHLDEIVASRPGYSQAVTMPPPRMGLRVTVINEIASWIKYHAVRAADKVFVLSAQVQWEVQKLYGRPSIVARAAFTTSFIDKARLLKEAALHQPARLLSVCRLIEKKRVALIIQAFAISGIDSVLRIVGDGPERETLEGLVSQLGIADRVQFLGAVDDEALVRELENADCFISMDIGDFDISVMEAMAKGLRVIVPRDFDISSLPAGLSGIVAVNADAESLARALRELPAMRGPTAGNLPLLGAFTWEALARVCVS